MINNIAIIGGSGALGQAFTTLLSNTYGDARIHVFSRHQPALRLANVHYYGIDYHDEISIAEAARITAMAGQVDLVLVTTGILHEQQLQPEKSLQEISAHKLQRLFAVNTIVPTLVAKYFLPILNSETAAIFAALSARVGSITDNRLGGWYSYRASKAALNIIIKTAAIEVQRRNKHAIVVGLHPGKVDSKLSAPFQRNVKQQKLFTPSFAAESLLQVLNTLTPKQSGRCFAWDGSEVAP